MSGFGLKIRNKKIIRTIKLKKVARFFSSERLMPNVKKEKRTPPIIKMTTGSNSLAIKTVTRAPAIKLPKDSKIYAVEIITGSFSVLVFFAQIIPKVKIIPVKREIKEVKIKR